MVYCNISIYNEYYILFYSREYNEVQKREIYFCIFVGINVNYWFSRFLLLQKFWLDYTREIRKNISFIWNDTELEIFTWKKINEDI